MKVNNMQETQTSVAAEAKADNEKTAKMAGAGAGVLAGAQLGTVVLPIPVVGTFTGALVGGLIGTKIGKRVGGVLLEKMNVAEKCYDQSSSTTEKSNLAKELERLVKLRDSGILSEDEFKAAKAKLLGL
jgi:phage tail tape-measure protein